MPNHPGGLHRAALFGLSCLVVMSPSFAAAQTVTLKNGIVYKGAVDKDNTLVSIFDPNGIKRVILRDSKILSTLPGDGSPKVVVFPIVQPMTVHAGEMPKAAYDFKIGEWDKNGRRTFSYRNERGKTVAMTQAIKEMGPKVCLIRGVDGFWPSQIQTSTVPRSIVMSILAKVQQDNIEERIRVCRFLVQAEWNTEARVEVERVAKDFAKDPDVAEKMKNARDSILDSEGRALLKEIDDRRKALQPRAVTAKLKSFPTEGMPADIVASVKDQIRKGATQANSDKALADSIRKAADAAKAADKSRLLEILDALVQAPDAVRDRLEAFEKGQAESADADELYALALSGFLAGSDLAVKDRKAADAMAKARDLARDYLATAEPNSGERGVALDALRALEIGGVPLPMSLLTEVVRRMPPPLRDAQVLPPSKPSLLRVRDEPNPDQPSEYAVVLPPEYTPLRSYPMVVALHEDNTPMEALAWWSAEAARRGFIVIAPEYNLRDQKRAYRYTQSEHAAVTLALRDALKRFSVDPDRVFVGGSIFGGEMAWDFGMSHSDLFAGIVVVSSLPAKYVWVNRPNLARVPFYMAIGDLAPAETDVIFGEYVKPLITKNYDTTYVEYYKRGLEDFPEEVPAIFDWMAVKRRDPNPRTFDVVASRDCDNRFYGVIVTEYAAGRTKDPAAMDIQGKNAKPATITAKYAGTTANKLTLTTSGVKSLEVWLGPKQLDLTKRVEIQVNNKTMYKALPKLDPETFLEDVRVRGDRSQVYWMKVEGTLGGR